MRIGIVSCLVVVTLAAVGCGGAAAPRAPSAAAERDVAGRFATALLRGDAAAARALLMPGGDGALVFLVRQAVAPWRGQRASIRLPARQAGTFWTVRFARRRTQQSGAFEQQSGDLVVTVTPSVAGARIAYFAFENLHTLFSTHRDSQLLPSKR